MDICCCHTLNRKYQHTWKHPLKGYNCVSDHPKHSPCFMIGQKDSVNQLFWLIHRDYVTHLKRQHCFTMSKTCTWRKTDPSHSSLHFTYLIKQRLPLLRERERERENREMGVRVRGEEEKTIWETGAWVQRSTCSEVMNLSKRDSALSMHLP